MESDFLKNLAFRLFFAWLTVLFGLALLTTHSCKHEGPAVDQMEEICFTEQVLPVFQNSCATAACHDLTTAENEYIFTDYAGIMKAITPGNTDKSKAYQAIISASKLMPPDNPLPIDKRTLIRVWIEQGAKETICGTDTSTAGVKSGTLWACYDRDIEPILSTSCAVSDCHDAISHKEGIDLSNYANVLKNIKPGNPSSSEIYEAITESPDEKDFMPQKPYSALSKAAIDTIYSWIKRGGLNERCASVCDTTGNIIYTSHIKPIIDLACSSCHGSASPVGGVKLLTLTDLKTVAESGKLLPAIQRKGPKVMPPTYALAACQIREIELWMQQGYQ